MGPFKRNLSYLGCKRCTPILENTHIFIWETPTCEHSGRAPRSGSMSWTPEDSTRKCDRFRSYKYFVYTGTMSATDPNSGVVPHLCGKPSLPGGHSVISTSPRQFQRSVDHLQGPPSTVTAHPAARTVQPARASMAAGRVTIRIHDSGFRGLRVLLRA